MKLSKGKVIVIVFVLVVVATIAALLYFNANKTEPTEPQKDLIAVSDNDTHETVAPTEEGEGDKVYDLEPVVKIDSKNFKYDPFAEDAGWGDESIFEGNIILEGSGKRNESGSQIVVEGSQSNDSPNSRELTPAEARAALMNEVKSSDYHYRINVNDFSDGFGIFMNPKYDLKISRIMKDTGYLHGPNGTEVGITELDPSISIDEHRKKLLTDSGYRNVYSYSDGAILEYGTSITIGSGIDDFENTKYYNAWRYNDESMNDYGGQLFCDTEMKSTFGEGYYIEMWHPTANLYYGYYLVEHNGRIFKGTGTSMYQDTLVDITLAAVDTCVYVY